MAVLPLHIVGLFTLAVGLEFTVTVAVVAVLVQPLASVTVIE